MQLRGLVLLCSLSILGGSCGGRPVDSPPPAAPPPVAQEVAPEPVVAEPKPEPVAEAAPEPAEAPTPEPEPAVQRAVKYVVSHEGLRVYADGVVFVPTAKAVRSGAGWAMQVRIEVRANDDAAHSLLAPTGSEMALAGEVRRAASAEGERFSDRRAGDRELVIVPNKAVTLARSWPEKDGPKPLAVGDELDLLVGIWGLGSDSASRRPLNKLCRIEVKFDKGQPRVKVMPPEGVKK